MSLNSKRPQAEATRRYLTFVDRPLKEKRQTSQRLNVIMMKKKTNIWGNASLFEPHKPRVSFCWGTISRANEDTKLYILTYKILTKKDISFLDLNCHHRACSWACYRSWRRMVFSRFETTWQHLMCEIDSTAYIGVSSFDAIQNSS